MSVRTAEANANINPGRFRPSGATRQLLLSLTLLLLASSVANAQTAAQTTPQSASPYSVHITRIDSEAFPTVRVYVSITDAQGNGIPDSQPVTISLQEDARQPLNYNLSEGLSVSTVLVLDVSGSMSGEKLAEAKQAATAYLSLVPSTHRFALVTVSSTARQYCGPGSIQQSCGFSADKVSLRNWINALSASGGTALQDGFGTALDLLKTRNDRKVVILLTDGYDTASTVYTNKNQLVERAQREKDEVFPIGLGSTKINPEYLRSLAVNGGQYLNSPTARQLRATFEQAVNILQKERVFEYKSASADPDGLSRSLSVELTVGNVSRKEEVRYTPPGLIPHVPGSHAPYLTLLLAMLIAPSLFAFVRSVGAVYQFRADQVVRLDAKSPFLGKRDPNVGQGGETFRVGDLIVTCPRCPTPHNVRSWRMNRCHCMYEPKGAGNFCYHRRLPSWLRKALDSMFGKPTGETGRRWLCRCAGEREGY